MEWFRHYWLGRESKREYEGNIKYLSVSVSVCLSVCLLVKFRLFFTWIETTTPACFNTLSVYLIWVVKPPQYGNKKIHSDYFMPLQGARGKREQAGRILPRSRRSSRKWTSHWPSSTLKIAKYKMSLLTGIQKANIKS